MPSGDHLRGLQHPQKSPSSRRATERSPPAMRSYPSKNVNFQSRGKFVVERDQFVYHAEPEKHSRTSTSQAMARICNSDLPTTIARSGWTAPSTASQILDNGYRTTKVFELCERINHTLAPHPRDRGICGQFHACHVGKQLITYHIYSKNLVKGVYERMPSLHIVVLENVSNDCHFFVRKVFSFFKLSIEMECNNRLCEGPGCQKPDYKTIYEDA